jgi:hypothetical protein
MAIMQQEACGAWGSVLRDSEKGSSNSPLYNVIYELSETPFIERDVGTLVGKEVGKKFVEVHRVEVLHHCDPAFFGVPYSISHFRGHVAPELLTGPYFNEVCGALDVFPARWGSQRATEWGLGHGGMGISPTEICK